jgi:hypothetical protein
MRKATLEMIDAARLTVSVMPPTPRHSVFRSLRSVMRREIVPGVEYATVEWILSLVTDSVTEARNVGRDDIAGCLYDIAGRLCDLLYDLGN